MTDEDKKILGIVEQFPCRLLTRELNKIYLSPRPLVTWLVSILFEVDYEVNFGQSK